MSNEKPTFERLEKTLRKLEAEREKRRKAEKRLKKLEKQYTDSLRHKERLHQSLLGLLAAVNMPRIYLDHKLNIVGFYNDEVFKQGQIKADCFS